MVRRAWLEGVDGLVVGDEDGRALVVGDEGGRALVVGEATLVVTEGPRGVVEGSRVVGVGGVGVNLELVVTWGITTGAREV